MFNEFLLRIFCIVVSMFGIRAISYSQSIPWFALNGSDPVKAIQLNPAFQHADNLSSSLHLSSIGIDYANNFGYFKDKSFLQLPFNISNISVPELEYKKNGTNPQVGLEREITGFEMKFNPSNFNKIYFSTNFNYTGPGYIKKAKNGLTWGLITGVEFHGGVNDFPNQTTYENYKNYREGNVIQVPLWNALGYGFFYLGAHGTKTFDLRNESKISLGVNIKYLGGLAYMSLENAESIQSYSFGNNEDVIVSNLLLNYAYTHSTDQDVKHPVKGNGAGADLGIYYSKKIKSRQVSSFRGGISIKNLGLINFNNSLRRGSLEINEPTNINFNKLDSINSLDQFIDSARTIVGSKPLNTYSAAKGQTVFLPAEFHITMSLGFSNYAKIHLLYSMPLSSYSPESIQFGFMPELTLSKVNIMVPFSYSQWTGFRLGAGINLDFLTFGTDDIRSFFKRDKLESGSFYLGVNIKKFEKPIKGASKL